MKNTEMELYTDYLLSTFGATTATGLSAMLEGDVSHDRITRLLSKQAYTSKDLWLQVKAMVRSVQSAEGVLIFDDTIQEKAWTDESELMCWHFDHCSGRNVRGINLLNAVYHSHGASLPVAFELVKKPIQYCDPKTGQIKRKSEVTKNELMRQMIQTCLDNALKFRFVLMDSWFASKENFEFITDRKHHFIAALKDNRLVALSEEDKKTKRFLRVDELDFPEHTAVQGWLKDYAKAVLVGRQVFTNKDGSTGILHLACSDLTCDYDAMTTGYKKRVASGGVSQILEVQRRPGQVTDANRSKSKQPCVHGHLRRVQAPVPEHQNQDQPVCPEAQASHQRLAQCLCGTSTMASGCVRSVNNQNKPRLAAKLTAWARVRTLSFR